MKLPFPLTVPNFHEQVSQEEMPAYVRHASKNKQEDYVNDMARVRRGEWCCRMICVCWNWLAIITVILLALFGEKMGLWVKMIAQKWLTG